LQDAPGAGQLVSLSLLAVAVADQAAFARNARTQRADKRKPQMGKPVFSQTFTDWR